MIMPSVHGPEDGSNQNEKSDVITIEKLDDTGRLDTIEDTKPGAFVWLCAAAAAIGGLLFGCQYILNTLFDIS